MGGGRGSAVVAPRAGLLEPEDEASAHRAERRLGLVEPEELRGAARADRVAAVLDLQEVSAVQADGADVLAGRGHTRLLLREGLWRGRGGGELNGPRGE